MAVIQISKIQVRRGLQENLPQLASGEFGWSVDTQRLYIGNGTLTEGAPEIGNTEILTSSSDIFSAIQSYIFKGDESGYTSITGAFVTTPVQRSLQHKLDEQVSVRDFGAVGDGTTDDTSALQRAIDQIFPADYHTTVGVRRVLHVPAGVYVTSANLLIPPYASIRGDGIRSTVIKKTAGTDSVVRLKDSRGNVGATVNTTISDAPFEITVKDLTLQTLTDTDIALLESCKYVKFSSVRFLGNVSAPVDEGTLRSGVRITDTILQSSRLSFDQCEFWNLNYGLTAYGDVDGVLVNNSYFDTLYQGIELSSNVAAGNVSPKNIRVTNSDFDQIASFAIKAYNATGLANTASYTSALNSYKTVGYGNASVVNSGTVSSYVLGMATRNSYSISDNFDRNVTMIENYTSSTATDNKFINQGAVKDRPGERVSITPSATANVATLPNDLGPLTIQYYIIIDGNYKTGQARVSYDQFSTAIEYDDEYTETANTGVILNFINDGANVILQYSDIAGAMAAGDLYYTVRSFGQ